MLLSYIWAHLNTFVISFILQKTFDTLNFGYHQFPIIEIYHFSHFPIQTISKKKITKNKQKLQRGSSLVNPEKSRPARFLPHSDRGSAAIAVRYITPGFTFPTCAEVCRNKSTLRVETFAGRNFRGAKKTRNVWN